MPYLLIRHTVQDYGKWKPVFDEHDATRRASGCKSTRLFRSAENPNETTILFEWDSLDNARRFVQSQDLRETMRRAGVVGEPEVRYLNDVDLLYERTQQ